MNTVLLANLIKIRWLAIAGQLITLLTVNLIFNFFLHLIPCLIVVSISVVINIFSSYIQKDNPTLTYKKTFMFLIFDISQAALDLNFDGLMIETHCDPNNAWSDAAQQVTPTRLVEIMKDLKVRKKTTDEETYRHALNNLRAQIDVVDQTLLDTLGKRMKTALEIGTLKKENNVAVLQNKRWNEILGKMILEGQERNLSEEFILRVFKAIHQESINQQEKIINS